MKILIKEDLKVGQYIRSIYSKNIEIIESVNSQYAYTNFKNRIYPKDYKYFFVLTEQDVKASLVHSLNIELENLLFNIQGLQEEVDNLANLPYITINTDEIEEDLKDIIIKISELLEEIDLKESDE